MKKKFKAFAIRGVFRNFFVGFKYFLGVGSAPVWAQKIKDLTDPAGPETKKPPYIRLCFEYYDLKCTLFNFLRKKT